MRIGHQLRRLSDAGNDPLARIGPTGNVQKVGGVVVVVAVANVRLDLECESVS